MNQYWLTVFANSGLIHCEKDIDAFSKLADFKSEEAESISLSFNFKEEPLLFTNRELKIEIKRCESEG